MTNPLQQLSPQDIAESRRWEFADQFGDNGLVEDAIYKCVANMERIAALCFGAKAARDGFATMAAAYYPEDAKHGWLHAFDENFSDLFSDLPLGTLFHNLEAYADFGISMSPAKSAADREAVIREEVELGQKFIELVPLDLWGLEADYAVRLVRKASVRWKLDQGLPVNAEELSLLSGLALQSIKNRLARGVQEIVGSQNFIEANEALLWLRARKDYRDSIWREQDDAEIIEAFDKPLEDVCFVPISADGTVFHPGLTRDGRYIVGPQGREDTYTDYRKALSALQAMPVAQWRRPTDKGVWTRVQAIEWRRVPMLELEELGASESKAT